MAQPTAVAARRRSGKRPNWVAGLLSLVWLVLVGVPLLMMVSWSLQHRSEYLAHGGTVRLPQSITFDNFSAVLSGGFLTYIGNSAKVTVASIALTLVCALAAAYAIVRSNSWFVHTAFRAFLLGLAIPAQAVVIPIYLIIIKLNLYDSLTAVVLPTVAFTLPMVVLVLSGSLRDITPDQYEAMAVDGAGAFRMFVNLVLPLSRAAIATVGIYTGLQAWNTFLFGLILTQSTELRVITLGLWNFQTEYGVNVPGLMAAVLLSALPMFVLYLFARRWLIAGFAGMGGK